MRKNNRGEDLKYLLGCNIKQLRGDSGFSQAELAEKADISIPYLGAVERGEKWPSSTTLAEIAYSLSLEPHDLLKPESTSSQEVRKVINKLTTDISALVNQSVRKLNNIAKESKDLDK